MRIMISIQDWKQMVKNYMKHIIGLLDQKMMSIIEVIWQLNLDGERKLFHFIDIHVMISKLLEVPKISWVDEKTNKIII